MVINNNNSQINSFVKGMNSDAAYDQIENTLYVFGQNVRITKNQSLGGFADYSSVHEGIVGPVLSGTLVDTVDLNANYNILSIKTVDNLGVIVLNLKNTKNIKVYRFEVNIDDDSHISKPFELVWTYNNLWSGDVPEKISTVLYKELDNVIKFYIATGEHPILTLRVDDDGVSKYPSNKNMNPDDLINNRIVPNERIYIKQVITGRLLSSQVQYTYRYYNKYGNSTQLAPLTNKIQVIDPSRSKETGNAENTETSIGFMLAINTDEYKNKFNRIQIFRLQYIKPGEDAEVSLIYDDKFSNTTEFVLNDVGIEPLQKYTMEEFSSMQGIILIPQVIEQNQEYMFCANVKDDTIIQDFTVEQNDNNVNLVSTDVMLDTFNYDYGHIPAETTQKYLGSNINIKDYKTGNNIMPVSEYIDRRGINPNNVTASYNDMFTSSLLRSLRRGEDYKYAIIFYDKYGRRSDVQPINDFVHVPSIDEQDGTPHFIQNLDFSVNAKPIGVQITLPNISGKYVDDGNLKNIVGCQIVRRSSSEIYQNTLLQVVLSRPVQQPLLETSVIDPSTITEDSTKKSPFYPTGLLNTKDMYIRPHYYNPDIADYDVLRTRTMNKRLYQIFSSEIDFRRDDVLSKLGLSDLKITPLMYIDGVYGKYKNATYSFDGLYGGGFYIFDDSIRLGRDIVKKLTTDEKQSTHWVFNFYKQLYEPQRVEHPIKQVKDVKMASWDSGFSDVTYQDLDIYTAIKKYRSYTTNIDSYLYNNWVSFGKYDLRAGLEGQPNMDDYPGEEAQEYLAEQADYLQWLYRDGSLNNVRRGYIGPGPSCFLIATDSDVTDTMQSPYVQTVLCNITHTPKITNVQSAQTEQYYGFGNYFRLGYDDNTQSLYVVNPNNSSDKSGKTMIVFDGDIYITPHEITTQFKTYDFQSIDTLQSTQITNYVPLESKVNTYLDYGMNLRNTNSENLLYEPGSIDGVTTQERPLHQYNMVYSDNDASNDVFTLISTDKDETNNFKQRAYYSELKSNGEFIDNFLIFKAAQFIDVDSRYGQITQILTDKNTLYYWQDQAFGKFSVNERSLINDQNNNTIMLGQAGILSRYDYMSTKYGMRLHDLCGMVTSNGLFWVDINNKAVVGIYDGQVVNYGERIGVQNIINNKIITDVPYVDYDLQNDELLCKCLRDGEQIVFNLKYNIATSIYTRIYDATFYIKNHLYSIHNVDNSTEYHIHRINYIKHSNNQTYLSPIKLEFVVNPSASITKVFDSQQIVPIKMSSEGSSEFMNNINMQFQTDIYDRNSYDVEAYTDREGNLIYNVPRYDNQYYGSRMRGKWMRVGITKTQPNYLFTISHIITKFRQSFS